MNYGTNSSNKVLNDSYRAWTKVTFYTDRYVASGDTQFDLVDETGIISSYALADAFGFADEYEVLSQPHANI